MLEVSEPIMIHHTCYVNDNNIIIETTVANLTRTRVSTRSLNPVYSTDIRI